MTITPLFYFDRSKPFYPLVMQTMITALAYKEFPFQIVHGHFYERGPALQIRWRGGTPIGVNAIAMLQDYLDNAEFLVAQLPSAIGTMLIAAHESTRPWHDTGPLWEFLYHCRNAAAHGGQLLLRPDQPRNRAAWRDLELNSTMQGLPLFRTQEQMGLLWLGDAIALLWDIEQAYPAMRANISNP